MDDGATRLHQKSLILSSVLYNTLHAVCLQESQMLLLHAIAVGFRIRKTEQRSGTRCQRMERPGSGAPQCCCLIRMGAMTGTE